MRLRLTRLAGVRPIDSAGRKPIPKPLRIGFLGGMRSLETLFDALRRCCETFPDKRRGINTTFAMADFGLAAFSVFFMQSPSFLAHQRRLEAGHGRSNGQSLFGLTRIPSDTQIRAMLDPVAPSRLDPVFAAVLAELQRGDGLKAFRRLGQHVLIALDGTEYFRSKKIHCPHCSHRTRADGTTEYFHTMLGATLVAPEHRQVLPLVPTFITPQDGADKQDCESRAAQRWLNTHGPHYKELKPIYLGDDLFAHQPMCEAVQAVGGHFVFVCKPSSHTLIQEYLTGIDLETHTVTVRRGRKRVHYRYSWMCDVPLRDGKNALHGNWFQLEIINADGKVTYHNSFITDLPVTRNTVAELVACGRARWKIENETFNVLKTQGYNIEHNFGHGKQYLAALLVTLNLLAFAMHTVADVGEDVWRRARDKAGSRRQFFHDLAALTTFLLFSSWDDLIETLAFAKPPPRPP